MADHLIRYNSQAQAQGAHRPRTPSGQPVELTIYATEADEARGVASKIVELVREGEYTLPRHRRLLPGDGPDPQTSRQAFRSAKIPYQVVGGVSFYERQEIKDVLAYLNLMANPKDDVGVRPGGERPAAGARQDDARPALGRGAEALGMPLLAMARQAPAVPGLKDKAARGAPRLRPC